MTQHTAGPWTVEKIRDGRTGVLIRAPSTGAQAPNPAVARIINSTFCYDEREANARLIAAAPTQNDALKMTLRWLLDSDRAIGEYDNVVEVVQAAIAKAETLEG